MGAHVALLRGINVGGKNRLPMRDLTAFFEDAGAADVRTYIQSGNVVFRATTASARGIPEAVAGRITSRFGYRVPVVLRSAAELERVVAGNPFLETGPDPKHLSVAFLEGKPSAAAVRTLDPDRSPPDEFVVCGRDIFLYCPNGVARTKLTNRYFASTLATVSTVRNWNTVRKLAEMAAEAR